MSWKKIPCPVCGNTGYREGRMCPKQSGAGVCITCCKACDCHRTEHPHPCAFYVKYPQIDYDAEITKLTNKIDHLREKVRYYYQRNWIKSAERKERGIDTILRERRRLEEERNERNNKNINLSGNRTCNNDFLHDTWNTDSSRHQAG